MFIRCLIFVCLLLSLAARSAYGQEVYEVKNGQIDFNSEAPNEIIKASSEKMQGLINVSSKQFAFKVEVASFDGFNSPLQKEHFNENYMESYMYPDIAFSGKIIEDIDLSKDGKYRVRAKGKLKIHGESVNRIIYADVTVKDMLIDVHSEFRVTLSDHNIKVPRVVNDKLATEVLVKVNSILMPRKE